jgi:hypothetical protein
VPHVFVETNWLFAYAAPAHHQVPAAAELLQRARSGEFTLHIPNVCVGEARRAILAKCQPRHEANAIRRFLSWAQPSGYVAAADAVSTRLVLDKYQATIKRDLSELEETLRTLATLPFVEIFGMDDAMLNRATELVLSGVDLNLSITRYSQAFWCERRSSGKREAEEFLSVKSTAISSLGTRMVTPGPRSGMLSTARTFGCMVTSRSTNRGDKKDLTERVCYHIHPGIRRLAVPDM